MKKIKTNIIQCNENELKLIFLDTIQKWCTYKLRNLLIQAFIVIIKY